MGLHFIPTGEPYINIPTGEPYINNLRSSARARVVISNWKHDYIQTRRHSALSYQPPAVNAVARVYRHQPGREAMKKPPGHCTVGVEIQWRGRVLCRDTGRMTPIRDDTEPLDVEFCTDVDRVDRDWLWQELTDHAYWARYRTRDMFELQLDVAWRVVGAYDVVDGRMVGFSRAFSDGAAVAYLADVYVDRRERGRGIGAGILRVMIDEGPGRGFRWMLHTNDAHALYATFGFTAPDSTFMQRDFRLPQVRT